MLNQLCQVGSRGFQLQLARIDARHIQQLSDEPGQLVGLAADATQRLDRAFRVELAGALQPPQHQLRLGADHGDRRPQLV